MNRRPNPAAEQLRSQQPDNFANDRRQAMNVSEAVATQQARQWLADHRIVPQSVGGAQRREALRAYIARLKTLPKPESRAWAYEIMSRIADGEVMPRICEQLASEVVAMGRDSQFEQETA